MVDLNKIDIEKHNLCEYELSFRPKYSHLC